MLFALLSLAASPRFCSFRSAFWRLNNVKEGSDGAFWKERKDRVRARERAPMRTVRTPTTSISLAVRHFNTYYRITLPPIHRSLCFLHPMSALPLSLQLHKYPTSTPPYLTFRPCRPRPSRELHRVCLGLGSNSDSEFDAAIGAGKRFRQLRNRFCPAEVCGGGPEEEGRGEEV